VSKRAKFRDDLCAYCGEVGRFYVHPAKGSRCVKCWSAYYRLRAEQNAGKIVPCSKCGQPSKIQSDGKHRCNACMNEYKRTYNATPKGRARRKAQHKRYARSAAGKAARDRYRARLKNERPDEYVRQVRKKILARHGLTPDDYLRMMIEQNGCCAICGDKYDHDLHVDHDHATEHVRQLLCRSCNNGLGAFNDSIDRMLKAIYYLQRHAHAGKSTASA